MEYIITQVIWEKLTWRVIAAVLPLSQSVLDYSNKILMHLERLLKFEASVRKTHWIQETET